MPVRVRISTRVPSGLSPTQRIFPQFTGLPEVQDLGDQRRLLDIPLAVDLVFGDLPVALRKGPEVEPADRLRGESQVDDHVEVFPRVCQHGQLRIRTLHPGYALGLTHSVTTTLAKARRVVADANLVPGEIIAGKAVLPERL